MPPEKVKVLYIAGEGRSGSTLLGRLLGEIPGAVHVGEVLFSLQALSRDCALCGCGQLLQDCDFWQEVFQRGFGGFHQVDAAAFSEAKQSLEHIRTLPRLLSPWRAAQNAQQLQEYQQALGTLYAAIRDVSGARVIVDGSKSVPYSYILAGVPTLDLRLLHLVRDSRAVAFSNQRIKADPSTSRKTGFLKQDKILRVAAVWNLLNLLLTLKKPGAQSLFLRYEDIIRNPAAALNKLWDLADEPRPDLEFLHRTPVMLGVNHTVNGNPNRFLSEVRLRLDDEWRAKMPWRQRALVTALTLPLLASYGYLRPPLPAKIKRTLPTQEEMPLS